MTRGNVRIRLLVLLVVLLLTACGDPEPGSQEDLRAQIDSIEVPAGMAELGRRYFPSCPEGCPTLVVWYELTRPPEEVRAELITAMTAAGWDVTDGADASSPMWGGHGEEHITFVVVDQEAMDRADNPYSPEGATAEISVRLFER